MSKVLNASGPLSDVHIETRASYQDDQSTIYPDMEITGVSDGEPFRLLIENKWGSAFNSSQMERYQKLLSDPNDRLAFICARQRDYKTAKSVAAAGSGFSCFLWSDIFSLLDQSNAASQTLTELAEFMKVHGLSPGLPISAELISSFISSREFFARLSRLCEKLANEGDWTFVPAEYRSAEPYPVKDRYGRIALEMDPGKWVGTITVGFLYDNKDHRVTPVDATSIDFFLRMEASPVPNAKRAAVVDALRARLPAIRQAGGLVHVQGDPQSKNNHTLLIAHQSLTKLIAGTASEEQQFEALFAQAAAWIRAIFADGTVSQTVSAYRRTVRS